MRHPVIGHLRAAAAVLIVLGASGSRGHAQQPAAPQMSEAQHAAHHQMPMSTNAELHMRLMMNKPIHDLIMADTGLKRLMHESMMAMSSEDKAQMHKAMGSMMSPEEMKKMHPEMSPEDLKKMHEQMMSPEEMKKHDH
jgi:hypothetical protein